MTYKQLPVHYFGHLSAVLKEHGIDLDSQLEHLGYDTQALLHQPNASISAVHFNLLMQKLLRKPALCHLGIAIGKRLHIAHHGAFGLAILNAPTLRSIVEFVAKYIVIRIPFIELTVQETGNAFRVHAHDLQWQSDVHRLLVEAVTSAFLNLQLALNERGNDIRITYLMFDYGAEQHEHMYRQAFGLPCQFDAAFSGFVIDKTNADDALVDGDDISFHQAELLCQQEKQLLVDNAEIIGRIRHYFYSQVGRLPSLGDTARFLAVSERTLNRELAKENTSFSQLSDNWLAQQAKEMLLARQLSVQQTAEQLGYAETSNFRRAFKRWFGCAPSVFIAQHGRGHR